jgi:diaminohydroxyphosphoribosylaminopyrimidine deaminase/5-amino-6-(5-phosphoribosylamino)uracil reductase
VLDRRLRLPADSILVQSARQTPTWLVTGAGHEEGQLAAYRGAGVEVIVLPDTAGPKEILAALGGRGLTRLLIEGGAQVAAAFLAADAIDRIVWMRAPGILGGDALAAIGELGLDRLAAMRRFDLRAAQIIQGECLETYDRLS